MKFMTPREYFQLLYECFFKAITLTEKYKDWKKKKQVVVLLQTSFYNFILVLVVNIAIILLMQLCSILFEFEYNFYHAIYLSLKIIVLFVLVVVAAVNGGGVVVFVFVGGVVGGVVLGVIGGVGGVGGGIGGGVVNDVIFYSVLNGVAVGIGGGVAGVSDGGATGVFVFFVVGGIAGGFVGCVDDGVVGIVDVGILYSICYIIFYGRIFYYPIFISALFKKTNLNKIPWHWDENIALPVPILSRILLKQFPFNKTGTVSEALFLIRNRKIHRKQAQKALSLIAVKEMKQFRSLENIAEMKQELSFLPVDDEVFNTEYFKMLQPIFNLEQDARIIRTEQNMADKIRLLHSFNMTLAELQKQYDLAKETTAGVCSRVVTLWQEIITKEIAGLEATSGRPLPNPFITGKPIHPRDRKLFKGRRDIIEQIRKEVLKTSNPGAILFLGNRRTGKTSTLLNMQPLLVTGIKSVFVDCQDATINNSLIDFCKELTKRITDVSGNSRKQPVECTNLAELTRYLKQLQQHLARAKKYILLCFDEYERIAQPGSQLLKLPDSFRYWIQHLENFIFLFAGAHRFGQINTINWSDYLINVRTVPISFLEYDACLQLVTRPVPEYDLAYQPAGLSAELVQRMGRQPFLVQVVMSELTELINSKNSKTATPTDVETAVERMFITAFNHLDNFWNSELSAEERTAALSIAHGKARTGKWQPQLKSLEEKEVLKKEGEEYRFCIPVIQEWIVKKIPL